MSLIKVSWHGLRVKDMQKKFESPPGFFCPQAPPAGVNISTEKRKLFPDNLLKTRNFSQGNCDLLKGTSINEVTFGVFLNPFPSPPL